MKRVEEVLYSKLLGLSTELDSYLFLSIKLVIINLLTCHCVN